MGLEYALDLNSSQVQVEFVRPWDDSKDRGYVATTVMVYIPKSSKDTLQDLLRIPNSKLYEQPNQAAKTLLVNLDPTIPLVGNGGGSTPGSFTNDASNGGSGGAAVSDSNQQNNNAATVGASDDGTNTSSHVKSASVGIGMGVVGGAAVYGAAMVWVARRYRKKRREHKRSGSATSQQMAQTSSPSDGAGVFVTGGRVSRNSDRSNRPRMISAPVTAANSLGWN